MFAHNAPPPRRLASRADDIDDTDEEEDGEDGDFEVFCNIRVEQAVLGRAPLVRNCKETTLGFSASEGLIKADMKSTMTAIRVLKNPNARIHGNRIHEGKLCVRDLKRNMMIMVSDADPQDLVRLKEMIMHASGTMPQPSYSSPTKRSPLGKQKRRSPLKTMNGNRRSPKQRKVEKNEEEEKEVALTEEQLSAVDAALEGKNIFITGGAGTGKSVVLREIIRRLPKATTFVTASTGVAACNVNGSTLHHFSGLGRGDQTLEKIAGYVARSDAGERWRRAKTLVIDEISMVSGETFDTLNSLAKIVRNSKAPFGGVQLVVCGDFFQLPPVADTPPPSSSSSTTTSASSSAAAKHSTGTSLCFEARAWETAITRTVQLKAVHRQSDAKFIRILEDIRWGRCTKEVLEMLKERSISAGAAKEAGVTKLLTHRSDVNRTNAQELQRLEGEARSLDAADDGDSQAMRALNSMCAASQQLTLKIGAQVILLKSIAPTRGLVNGARGEVVGFTRGLGMPVVQFDNGEKETITRETWGLNIGGGRSASRSQVPLGLAWAMSIHKSQGISLSAVHVSLSRVFEAGQAYVALSRARSLKGLGVLDFAPTAIRADPRVLAFYRGLGGQ